MRIEVEFDGKPIVPSEHLLDNKTSHMTGQFQGFLSAIMSDLGKTSYNTFRLKLINDDHSYMEFGKEFSTNNE